jgi:hypothetical protein
VTFLTIRGEQVLACGALLLALVRQSTSRN